MNLLALDTSSIACTVALQLGVEVAERYAEKPREHTRLLLPMIEELLAGARADLRALDAIVLGNGPGSFIGLRIAASVVQGLAYGAGLDVAPVSSLAAVAGRVFATSDAGHVAVAQDAHMSEVYFGLFERGTDGLPVAVGPERLHGISVIEALRDFDAGGVLAAGIGWERYPGLLAANRDFLDGVADVRFPRGRDLLPLGAAVLADGAAVEARSLAPAYLRDRVAAAPYDSSGNSG